jgi:signal transduction histidine kinase
MRSLKWLFQPVLIFVVAQVSWALLMFVWIRWYLRRNQEIDALVKRLPLNESLATGQWVVLLEGCLLMAIILVGLYFIFVSLRKQTKLNKLKDSILSSVTHELKTPLASIRLYTETIMLRPLSEAEREKFLKRMLAETERLQKLIDTVLISARMDSDPTLNEVEDANVIDIIYAAWRKTTERAGETRIFTLERKVTTNDGQFRIQCNVHQLSIVFDNLLDNAVKYTSQQGNIVLRIDASENLLRARLSDDGLGIEKSHLKKIFNRFFRAEKISRTKVHGSGLGLFVCKNIVKAHKGRIFASSDGQDKGSTFYVELPRNTSDR